MLDINIVHVQTLFSYCNIGYIRVIRIIYKLIKFFYIQ